MPSPSSSLVTLRPDLAGSLMEFELDADRAQMIGHRIFPVVTPDKPIGQYGKIPIEQLLKQRETKRGPGAGYSRDSFTFTKITFACEEHGHEELIDDREAEMYSEYFDAELVATARGRHVIMGNAEQRYAALLHDTSVYTGAALTTAITNEWDDKANAVPVDDVKGAVFKVYDGTGCWPNALAINRKQFYNVRLTDQVRDFVAASGAGDPNKPSDITADMLAQVFGLDFVLVAGGSKNSAIEGQAASPAQIWSDEYAVVCKVATTDDIREPCVGRTIHYAGDGSTPEGIVESYEDPERRSEVIRVRHDVDEKLHYVELAHLLSNVTT